MRSLNTRAIFAGIFAALGVGAASWMVFGPAIERWWDTPKPRPVEHTAIETDLAAPQYTTFTSEDELQPALERLVASLRSSQLNDPRVTRVLSSADRAALAESVSSALRPLLTGSLDEYREWLRATGASHSLMEDDASAASKQFIAVWSHNVSGYAASPLDATTLRIRLRYQDGDGPYPAPEDDLRFGHSSFPTRFPGLPDDPERFHTIVETIVPVMHINKESGVVSNTMLGFWMARHKQRDPWRLWRIVVYDFERPSRAFVPVF